MPTTTERDGLHRVAYVVDAPGYATNYEYDLDSNVVRVQPPAGGATITHYDSRGFVEGGSNPDGSWSQDVDDNGNVTRYVNLRQGTTTSQYDSLDRLVFSSGPAVITTYVHDGTGSGDRYSTVTVGPRTTRTEYDARGRVKAVIEPDNATRTENFYDEQDQLLASQVKKGGALQTCTVQFRDARDRVFQVRTQDGEYKGTVSKAVNAYTLRDPSGFVVRKIDGESRTTSYVPDARGRVHYVLDGYDVIVEEYLYGDDDLVYEVRVPNPATKSRDRITRERRGYTARKEPKRAENLNGHGVTKVFGPLPGQVTLTTNAKGHQTKMDYHLDTQRVSAVTEAMGTPDQSSTFHDWEGGLPVSFRQPCVPRDR
jgi:YD repeat-containing protein